MKSNNRSKARPSSITQAEVHTKGLGDPRQAVARNVEFVNNVSLRSGESYQYNALQQQQQEILMRRMITGGGRSPDDLVVVVAGGGGIRGGGDESPVSVISSFLQQASHPSSASTSMEHPPPPILFSSTPGHHHHHLHSTKVLDSIGLTIGNSTALNQYLMKPCPQSPKQKETVEWLNLQGSSQVDTVNYQRSNTSALLMHQKQQPSSSSEEDHCFHLHHDQDGFFSSAATTRDADEDSVIDFFPSDKRASSAMQSRRQSHEKINELLTDQHASTVACQKAGMLISKGGGGHECKNWSKASSKWDDAERWLINLTTSVPSKHAMANRNDNDHVQLQTQRKPTDAAPAAYNYSLMSDQARTQDKHAPQILHELRTRQGGGRLSGSSLCLAAAMREASTEIAVEGKRDIATQSTPHEGSRYQSPDSLEEEARESCSTSAEKPAPALDAKASPPRHNTPARRSMSCSKQSGTGKQGAAAVSYQYGALNLLELESCHLAKLKLARDLPLGTSTTWQLYSGEEDTLLQTGSNGNLTVHLDEKAYEKTPQYYNPKNNNGKLNMLETRVSAWEDVERAKHTAKFKREEAKIEAWESLQRAEADAELKKLEVKLEKMRFEGREKILGRLGAAQRRAQEMRATAEAHKAEQLSRVGTRANQIRKTGHLPTSTFGASTFNVVCSLTTKIKPT